MSSKKQNSRKSPKSPKQYQIITDAVSQVTFNMDEAMASLKSLQEIVDIKFDVKPKNISMRKRHPHDEKLLDRINDHYSDNSSQEEDFSGIKKNKLKRFFLNPMKKHKSPRASKTPNQLLTRTGGVNEMLEKSGFHWKKTSPNKITPKKSSPNTATNLSLSNKNTQKKLTQITEKKASSPNKTSSHSI